MYSTIDLYCIPLILFYSLAVNIYFHIWADYIETTDNDGDRDGHLLEIQSNKNGNKLLGAEHPFLLQRTSCLSY
jgi:hypothetical protein